MRKVFCVFTFLLCALAVFAQGVDEMYMRNEGSYFVAGFYLGNAQGGGQIAYENCCNSTNSLFNTKVYNTKLTKGQWECVHRILNRYDSTKGDLYNIVITTASTSFQFDVIVEFTSDAEYSYWLLKWIEQ